MECPIFRQDLKRMEVMVPYSIIEYLLSLWSNDEINQVAANKFLFA